MWISKACAGHVSLGHIVDLSVVPCYTRLRLPRSSVMNPDISVSMCLHGPAPRATTFVGTFAVSRTPRDELQAEKPRCARRDFLVRLNAPK